MTRWRIVGLGELLWDLLPAGRRLGGAPANFAVTAARLGDHGIIASRVGEDEPGIAARSELAGLPVETDFVQSDAELATGAVSVALEDGQPSYTIHQPAAWDALALTPAWHMLACRADAVCFGTLAQRAAESRQTIRNFLEATQPECVRIFDVNLRPPFYSAEVLADSLAAATILKLNDAELPVVVRLLGLGAGSGADILPDDALLDSAHLLLDASPNLRLVCITLGEHGSLLVKRTEHHRHPGVPTAVADAVGAGDAFTAALAHEYLSGGSLDELNQAGNRWGSWVASQPGAMPPAPE